MSVTTAASAARRAAKGRGKGLNAFETLANRGGILSSGMSLRKRASSDGNMSGRLETIESRLDALEDGGGQDVTQPSPTVSPAPVGVPGGSEVAASNVTADNDSVSVEAPTTFAPSAVGAAGDIFGKVFMRDAAMGAAKMIKNKKI